MNEIYKRKRNSYLGNKSISSKFIIGVVLLSIFINFNDFNINFALFDTTIQQPLLKDLALENYEESSNSFAILDNYIMPKFDSLEAKKWREKFLSIDRNQNGIHDDYETKLNSLSKLSDTTSNKKLLSKQDIITNLLGNNEVENIILTLDKIPFIIQFPEGNYEEILSLFNDLGGKVDSTYKAAINGFAGNINHHDFIQFNELLNEADLPYLIEEDNFLETNLYFASRNMNLRPYVWNDLSYTGDDYSSIAIIDTGIDDTHSFFPNGYSNGNFNYKIVGWRDEVSGITIPYDDNGHGSHCSGIATSEGGPTLDGSGRTVSTSSMGFDYTGYYVSPQTIDITSARFEVTDPGIVEVQCEFNDYTPGSDRVRIYAYLYHDETIVDSYVSTSTSWSDTLSYTATSSTLGDYSLRIKLIFYDGNSDSSCDNPHMRFRGEIHWPFNPPLLGSGDPWKGVAPDAHLVGVKVLDGTGGGYASDIVAGLNWVITNKNVYNITTLSMSLGGSSGQTSLINAVNNAVENGIVAVCSAGNDGGSAYYTGSPGDADNAITVAAMSNEDRVTDYSSSGGYSYSGATTKPDIMAPGGSYYNFSMFSTDTNDNDAEGQFSTDGFLNDLYPALGTSMATPAVAGAANLLIDAMGGHDNWNYTGIEAKRVKALLLMTATETYPLTREITTSYSPTLERGGKDRHEGYGRINIDAAIEACTDLLNQGDSRTAILTSSDINSYGKHALGCYVNLIAGNIYKFNLDVPLNQDFDLYIYSNSPSTIGEPMLIASSVSGTSGGLEGEYIEFTPSTTGRYYIIVKAISGRGIASLTFISNDFAPSLDHVSLNPKSGSQATQFNFSVTYTDLDNFRPNYVNVIINGIAHEMEKVDLLDNDYTDGCEYQYLTYLDPLPNNYTYSFECYDGEFSNSTAVYNDLEIKFVNNFNPTLTVGQVNPGTGRKDSTIFSFSVIYTDLDNNAPLSINVTVNSTTYSMSKQNITDNNYMDGCLYAYSTILSQIGEYQFYFNCSDDAINIINLGPYNGPLVEDRLVVGILNSNENPSYFQGGRSNDYTSIYNGLISSGIDALILTSDDIIAGDLDNIDVLVLIDNTPNDAASTILKAWCLDDGGIVSFDSSICFLNWAGLIPPEAVGTNGYTTYWDYSSSSQGRVVDDTHPVMAGYNYNDIISGTSGDSRYFSATISGTTAGPYYYPLVKEAIGSNYDYIVALDAPYAGKVVHFWDRAHWATSTNRQMILNAINWVIKPNLYSPILTNSIVVPNIGDQNTLYTFNVIYSDQDNNAPSSVNVIINGGIHTMSKFDPSDSDYVDGCLYEYSTYLVPSAINYTYSFNCSDNKFSSSTATYNDLQVIETNNFIPKLMNPEVTPTIGGYGTNFYFSVEYFDEDNNLPLLVDLILNNSMKFSMIPVNPLDTYAVDGIQYYYQTTMDFGYYQFLINCSDYSFSNSTGWIEGPEVNPFYNLGPVSLLYPSSNASIFSGFNEFAWMSLNAPFGPVNYTFQISDTSDFSNILYELYDIVETLGSTMVNFSVNLSNGLYYWAVTPTYEQFSGVRSNPEIFNLIINEFEPVLSNPSVDPKIGDQHTIFNFEVMYFDQDGNSPQLIVLDLNGTLYAMEKVDPLDNNYVDGCQFQFSTLINPWEFNYTYSFNCFDGKYSNSTIAFNDLQVIVTNFYVPKLFNPQVSPEIGINSTDFTFSVLYLDYDNNLPISVNITINSNVFSMFPLDPLDKNATDGILYYYNTLLNFGLYQFKIDCSDGLYTNSTGWLYGPEVNPFLTFGGRSRIQINEICANPDFIEMYNYGTDLDMTGWYIEIYDDNAIDVIYTFPTGWVFRSNTIVVLHENTGTNTETNLYTGGNIMWANRPIAAGLFDKYGNNIDWVQTSTHTMPIPSDAEWIQDISWTMDNNYAYRTSDDDDNRASDWVVSSSGSQGSLNPGQTGEGSYDYIINLVTPLDGITLFSGLIDFSWVSLDAHFGPVNYTLQISNTPDFSSILEEITNINEIPGITNTSLNLNFPTTQYYWRVCPTYNIFMGNWSEYFTLNLIYNENSPQLLGESVNPPSGNQFSNFNFTVIYHDIDNNAPLSINLILNSTPYSMSKVDPLDNDYSDGCLYQYITTLTPSDYNYTYYYTCDDGKFTNATVIYNDLEVIEINLIAPSLSNAQVSPELGSNGTIYTFVATYIDADNNLPSYVNITIRGISYSLDLTPSLVNIGPTLMLPVNPSDTYAIDGIQYYFETTLNFGLYEFQINCSDGFFLNSTGWVNGPESSPLYQYGPIQLVGPISGETLYSGLIYFFWSSIEPSFGSVNYTIQISDTSDFSNILEEVSNIPETSIRTNISLSLYYPTNAYYWRVQSNYGPFVGSWSTNSPFTLIYNEMTPDLLDDSVNPKSGDQYSTFTFSVTYYDQDNNAPQYVRVYINGGYYLMGKLDPSDQNYIDGCVYQYQTSLAPSASNYTYYFTCNDGRFTATTSVYNDLEVIESNFYAPSLLNYYFLPGTTINAPTTVTFYVNYYDNDNNLPQYILISLRRGLYDYTEDFMTKVNPSDTNAMDGIQYTYNIFLNYGSYSFQIYCSDGLFTSSTGLINGPVVNPFGNYGIIFIDDFEDQILSPQWTIEYGDAIINSATANSGSYSLAISAYGSTGTRVNSAIIDLSGNSNLLLSMWIRSGSSSFSEPPDSGEDLSIYYYNNIGSWVLLGTILGSDPDPRIYTPTFILPGDAYHSNFRIRLSHSGGTMNPGDYYHVDDVMISGNEYITLFSPSPYEIIIKEPLTFIWSSLEASFGAVNYTLQVSSTSDFSNILLNYNNILETPVYTSINFTSNLQNGMYFWRIRPTYAGTKGSWSEIGSFIVNKPLNNPFLDPVFIGILITVLIIGIAVVLTTVGYLYNKKSKKSKSKKATMKPLTQKGVTRPSYTQSRSQISHPRIEQLKEVKKIINTQLMPPLSRYSSAGQKTLEIANKAIIQFKGGNAEKGVEAMLLALKMGVPEPENGIMKNLILNFIDGQIEAMSKKESVTQSTISQIYKCPNCNMPVGKHLKFCTKCGTKLERIESKVEESSNIVCQKCNAKLPSGIKFCTQCGTKLDSNPNDNIKSLSGDLSPIPQKEPKEQTLEKIPEPKEETFDLSEIAETNEFSLDKLKQLKNDIDYAIKPSISGDTPQALRAITIANASLKALENGHEDKALELMEASLKMGLKEPEYKKIKNIALGIIKKKLEIITKEEKKSEDSIDKNKVICPHCKYSLPPDSLFCVYCGKSITSKTQVQKDIKPEVKPLSSIQEKANYIECSNCGHSNEPNLNFCTKCGSKL